MNWIDDICRYYNIDNEVKSLEELDNDYDIKTRYISLTGKWYNNAVLPMLAGGKFIVPDAFGKCRYSENGKNIRITEKNCGEFEQGDAVCFYRGLGNGKITAFGLIKYMLSAVTLKDKLIIIICSVLVTAMALLIPVINYMVFNHIIPSGTLDDVMPVTALLCANVCISAITVLLQMTVISNVISKVGIYLQGALFSRILRLRVDFFKDYNSGEIADLIMKFTDMSSIFSANTITSFINIVLAFSYLIQMNIYAPGLMPWVYAVTLIIIALKLNEAGKMIEWKKKYTSSYNELSALVYEAFSMMENIKLNGASERMFSRWAKRYYRTGLSKRKPVILKYSQAIMKFITLFSITVIFILGINSQISLADFTAFNSSYGAYIAVLSSLTVVLESTAVFGDILRQLNPVLNAETEISEAEKPKIDIEGNIDISNLRFKYAPDLPYVLDGINLSIKKGECIGIVGGSGSGKSTLLRLLLGFEKITEGGIFVDNFDIRELDLKEFRKNMGIVLQDSKLMSDDIYSNITISYPEADNDDVYEAVENAGLSDDIDKMPMGLRTLVSEENCTLSGGQKQRILIARAIIKKPSILIFDEATSALDNITQAKVTQCVEKLKATRIIIAHRLSTIKNCDRIVLLKNGKIAEQGSFEELMSLNGDFAELASRQTV